MTTTAEPAQITITKPGVYDIPTSAYLADPVPGGSLSSSGARRLLPPSCPALFAYEREHGRPPKREFDFGHAAHRLVLGVGEDIAVVDADDWRTTYAKTAAAEARDNGQVPLLRTEYAQVQAMADALRQHPVAAALLNPDRGTAEQSLFWPDPEFQVWRRARLDWLPHPSAGRSLIVDYKTSRSAAPDQISRAIHDYGYGAQGDWYLALAKALGLVGDDAAFLLIVQEKTPPYLVTVAQPDALALLIGRDLNRAALNLYRTCTETGRWPGHSDDVELIGVPGWVERAYYAEGNQS